MTTKEEWDQIYDKSLVIWDNLTGVIKDDTNLLQTKNCPMHPNMFFQLSQVRGFNDRNGNTYEEYVNIWKSSSE